MNFKTQIFNHVKNIPGWHTNRKIIVFSIDDFGNVRLGSKQARMSLDKEGFKPYSRFDTHDTLEAREDLYALYDVLTSVKDVKGSHAIFTPFSLTCNLNFEKVEEDGFKQVHLENLNETYHKLSMIYPKIYDKTWEAWNEGIKTGIFKPEFHGREHFNYNTIQNRLNANDIELLKVLKCRSLTNLSKRNNETPYSVAFGYQNFKENKYLASIINDGIERFQIVFGFKPSCFMPPSTIISPILHENLISNGIKSIDTRLYGSYQYSEFKNKIELRWSGKKIKESTAKFIVRNCVFEPFQQSHSLEICKSMINAAFSMNKPAIISSHRINFVGSIDESIRNNTLCTLKELLHWVKTKYPEVEFLSLSELVEQMSLE
jgi:hypothetical protein